MEISPGMLDRTETYEILRPPYMGVILSRVYHGSSRFRGEVRSELVFTLQRKLDELICRSILADLSSTIPGLKHLSS